MPPQLFSLLSILCCLVLILVLHADLQALAHSSSRYQAQGRRRRIPLRLTEPLASSEKCNQKGLLK